MVELRRGEGYFKKRMEEKEGQTTEKGRKRRDKDKEVRSREKAGGGSNKNKGGKRGWRIGFWNVAGLRNKDKEFWNGLRRWEVMVMVETWVERKRWKKIKGKLPKGYKWRIQ